WSTPPCHAGTQKCTSAGTWGSCDDVKAPEPEACGDGVDNDCNGTVDDGCGCVPSPEVCDDGKDNDCDGVVANGCKGNTTGGDAGGTDSGKVTGGDAGGADVEDGGKVTGGDAPCGTQQWKDPVLKCQWDGDRVLTSPLAADLDGDGETE